MVNFVLVVAYHFCLSLTAAFTQPGDHLLAEPCGAIALRGGKLSGWLFGAFVRRNPTPGLDAAGRGRIVMILPWRFQRIFPSSFVTIQFLSLLSW